MELLKLKTPDYNLADYILEEELIKEIGYTELEEFQEAKEFGDVPKYTIVPVTIYEQPIIAIYLNNGQVFFQDNDCLEDYLLEWTDFWFVDRIFDKDGNEVVIEDFDLNFDFDYDNGLEWEGRYDTEEINRQFLQKEFYAKFVGFYRVVS